ncbi:endoplasmic reticulum metallopeptidase 1-like [Rhopalosiphum maidis]|uniref:endoplasmic reticulum metallopeptidase 1-like n=1 Tax=Rhopalosiphum maidis TaxID=43146 RepID=UPI000EFE844C|nr:endoplasmic reticulum metallopeptidase 1-like [Rhopalosiphum maidis]
MELRHRGNRSDNNQQMETFQIDQKSSDTKDEATRNQKCLSAVPTLLVSVTVLIILNVFVYYMDNKLPHPIQTNSTNNDFVAERAMSTLIKLANLGPRPVDPKQGINDAILLNCHYDTVPAGPGVSDNGVNCAVMVELLRILSKTPHLRRPIIFLFNGGEEIMLQASHGFVTQHPWSKNAKYIINLDSCGAGGREILFQTTKSDSYLVDLYARTVPHPYGQVIGEELFQSGVIPSDTDFRIFRDFGNMSGLDLAHYKNGYVYHTKHDDLNQIGPSVLQNTGENLFALAKAMSTHNATNSTKSKYVFFDVFGVYMIHDGRHEPPRVQLAPVDGHRESGLHDRGGRAVVSAGGVRDGPARVFDELVQQPDKPAGVLRHRDVVHTDRGGLLPENPVQDRYRMDRDDAQRRATFLDGAAVRRHHGRSAVQLPVRRHGAVSCGRQLRVGHTERRPGASRLDSGIRRVAGRAHRVRPVPDANVRVAVRADRRTPRPNVNPDYVVGALMAMSAYATVGHLAPAVALVGRPRPALAGLGAAILVMAVTIVAVRPVGFPYSSAVAEQRFDLIHTRRAFYDFGGGVRYNDSGYLIVNWDRQGPRTVADYVPDATRTDCASELMCGVPVTGSLAPHTGWLPGGPPPALQRSTATTRAVVLERDERRRRIAFNVTGPERVTVYVSPYPGTRLKSWSFAGEPEAATSWMGNDVYVIKHSSGAGPAAGGPQSVWSFWLEHECDRGFGETSLNVTVAYSWVIHKDLVLGDEFRSFVDSFPQWSHVNIAVASVEAFVY